MIKLNRIPNIVMWISFVVCIAGLLIYEQYPEYIKYGHAMEIISIVMLIGTIIAMQSWIEKHSGMPIRFCKLKRKKTFRATRRCGDSEFVVVELIKPSWPPMSVWSYINDEGFFDLRSGPVLFRMNDSMYYPEILKLKKDIK